MIRPKHCDYCGNHNTAWFVYGICQPCDKMLACLQMAFSHASVLYRNLTGSYLWEPPHDDDDTP